MEETITLVKRTIWVAKCLTCEFQDTRVKNPPREMRCPNCKTWIDYVENTYTGKSDFSK